MKFLLFVAATLSSSMAIASPNCSYVLNQEAYWEDASGVLIVNTQKYNCKTLIVGQEGDLLTVCKDPKKKSMKPEMFDFIVDFDGAESDFTISTDLGRKNTLCKGIASEK